MLRNGGWIIRSAKLHNMSERLFFVFFMLVPILFGVGIMVVREM